MSHDMKRNAPRPCKARNAGFQITIWSQRSDSTACCNSREKVSKTRPAAQLVTHRNQLPEVPVVSNARLKRHVRGSEVGNNRRTFEQLAGFLGSDAPSLKLYLTQRSST